MKLKALALLSMASMLLCGCTAKNITPATSGEEPESSVVAESVATSETSDVLSVSESESVLRDEVSSVEASAE